MYVCTYRVLQRHVRHRSSMSCCPNGGTTQRQASTADYGVQGAVFNVGSEPPESRTLAVQSMVAGRVYSGVAPNGKVDIGLESQPGQANIGATPYSPKDNSEEPKKMVKS